MEIGNKIKQRRLELGLSADDLAEKIGKSRATVYRYENGDIENMPTTVLEPIAKVLKTSPAALMGWHDDSSSTTPEPTILRTDEQSLLRSYNQLNVIGKGKAIDYVEDLTENTKYTEAVDREDDPDPAEDDTGNDSASSGKIISMEPQEDEDAKIVETFQKRFVARNGNKNLTPGQMKTIMDILDRPD